MLSEVKKDIQIHNLSKKNKTLIVFCFPNNRNFKQAFMLSHSIRTIEHTEYVKNEMIFLNFLFMVI